MTTSSPNPGFWPDGARLVVSISMQFEAGAQPERGPQGPFPPLDPRYPDLPRCCAPVRHMLGWASARRVEMRSLVQRRDLILKTALNCRF